MPQTIRFTEPNGRQEEMIAWTSSDLDEAATISDADKQTAQRYWRNLLPRRWQGLLDAISTIARALPVV